MRAKAYPVPDRQRWGTMIQLLDGTQIAGADDGDVLDRWRSLNWAADPMTLGEFRERIAGHARTIYGCGLIGVGRATKPDLFLDALAAEGVLTVIRK